MHSEAGPCAEHTDNMVELRYSLWRVPMALHAMVTAFEKVNKVWHTCSSWLRRLSFLSDWRQYSIIFLIRDGIKYNRDTWLVVNAEIPLWKLDANFSCVKRTKIVFWKRNRKLFWRNFCYCHERLRELRHFVNKVLPEYFFKFPITVET